MMFEIQQEGVFQGETGLYKIRNEEEGIFREEISSTQMRKIEEQIFDESISLYKVEKEGENDSSTKKDASS